MKPKKKLHERLNRSDCPDLTKREFDALKVIRAYFRKNQIPPTYREIAEGMGLSSVSSSTYFVARLEEKGYIVSPVAGRHRGLRLLG